MSDQQQKQPNRSPRFGGKTSHQPGSKPRPNTENEKKNNNKKKPQLSKAAGAQDNVRYAVIITNVENDFGKLHSASLPYYCGLRPEFEETLDVERLVNAGGPEAQKLVAAVQGCGYAVRCRTETRSAEIGFYGPADADFGPMQLQKQSHRPTRNGEGATTTGATSADERNTAAPASSSSLSSQAASGAATDPTALPATKAEAEAESTEETAVAATVAPASALESLALRLRRMRYFEDKIPVHVHLPGHAAGEVLMRAGGVTSETAATTAKVGEKRAREPSGDDKAEDDGVDDASTDNDADDVAATMEERDKIPLGRGKQQQQQQPQRQKKKAAAGAVLKQFPNRQKDFVTAVAALSVHMPLRAVRRKLHDLPGYMSCWSLYEKHVRVMFRDAESLFKAKQLLDQFELDAGLRVSLMLSDAHSRGHTDFVRAQEAEEAE